jgi:chromosome segregation ATPase
VEELHCSHSKKGRSVKRNRNGDTVSIPPIIILHNIITRKQREEYLAIDGEINNYNKAIEQEQAKNEQLTGIYNKVNTEITFLEKQLQKFKEKKENLIAQYSQTQKSLEHTESMLAKVMIERRGLEEQVNSLQREGDGIVNDTVKLEDQIAQNLQIQKTLEKSANNTEAGASKISSQVREKVGNLPIDFLLTFPL